jgi:hypothetical protein
MARSSTVSGILASIGMGRCGRLAARARANQPARDLCVLLVASTVRQARARRRSESLSLFHGSLFTLFTSVSLEGLRQQASVVRPVLEEVNDADGGIGELDPGLDQRKVPGVA